MESWPNWLRWLLALPASLLAAGAIRLFFLFLEWSISDRTGFFEGGFAYLLTSNEIGRHALSFIVEGFACYGMFAAFMHVVPSHHQTARIAFLSVVLTLLFSLIGFSLILGTGESKDIVGIVGGMVGYFCYYFGDDDTFR